ncbi:hypothetical protein [Pseudolysinimonas sp.]|uniref:hypothetical protein n=1 Tax=Pseudolysinimonas sp. TaxID=2680009 RepID=UPI00286AD998|nr:hypothetical protein [Pseudolysinimonas sp.]
MARAGDVDAFDDDDEALSWAGDEEQGRAAPRVREPEAPPVSDEAEPEEAPGSRGRSVATAAFVVPYLAITVGWIFAVQQLSSGSASLFGEILWQFGEFLAMLAAPLWLAATLTLTRAHRPLVRVGWLALGLAVVFPWPLVLRFLAALEFAGGLS